MINRLLRLSLLVVSLLVLLSVTGKAQTFAHTATLPGAAVLTDRWQPLTLMNAPAGRRSHTTVWTGTEVLIWGGETGAGGYTTTNTGAKYNPISDTWTPISTVNAPSARRDHSAVWTGTEMIVWGGVPGNSGPTLNDGGRYNPQTDTWTPLTTTNAPSARHVQSAIWTGQEMIVWGGGDLGPVIATNTGGRYNPQTDTWTPITTSGAPSPRFHMIVVWTGTEMLVWGGSHNCCGAAGAVPSGGRYHPQTDTWSPMATGDLDAGFVFQTGVWTGSELMVWGGYSRSDVFVNTGQRYNPTTDVWTPFSTINAPSGRGYLSSVWTGDELLVWGGYDGSAFLNTGGRYDPETDTWIPTTMVDVPARRGTHTTIWTGNEVLVWGGFDNDGNQFHNTGARYGVAELPTATPTPTPNGLLFHDDFDQGTYDQWQVVTGSWYVQDGTLGAIYNCNSGPLFRILAGDSSWSDYRLTFDIKRLQGWDGGNVLVRNSNSGHYWIEFHPNTHYGGKIILYRYDNLTQQATRLVDQPWSTNVDQWYRFVVTVSGARIQVHEISPAQELVLDVIDPSPLAYGQIGFMNGAGAVCPTDVLYDNVDVYALTPATATPTPDPTLTPTSTSTPTATEPVVANEEIMIPAGPFQMGCDSNKPAESCRDDEHPLHTVNLAAYYIDKYEVTNARYQACVDAGGCTALYSHRSYTHDPYYGNPTYANYPVIEIDWSQADAFCTWEGKRLPSEAEWEKAARGSSDTRIYPWGDSTPDCTQANFARGISADFCIGDTSPVGSYPTGASPYGVMDMAGNVWEWVNDRYSADYYSTSPANNPLGPATGTNRIMRGGSWSLKDSYMRAALREGYNPIDRGYNNVGFRCARSQSEPTPTATPTLTATPTPTPNPSGPVLQLASNVTALPGSSVTLALTYAGHANNVASTAFSIDFDQTCLRFDITDGNDDGLPDALHVSVPPAFVVVLQTNLADSDGELDFFIGDNAPPLTILPDGVLATLTFTVSATPNCQPATGQEIHAPVVFAATPRVSFGSTTGLSMPGNAVNGGVVITAIAPGDGNGDNLVDAGDIAACILEIFDDDGEFWLDAFNGEYRGTPGCDANRDTVIDAGDITCTVLLIFNGPGACGTPFAASHTPATAQLAIPPTLTVAGGEQLAVPIQLTTHGADVAAAAFVLHFDPARFAFDPTDHNGDERPDSVLLHLPPTVTHPQMTFIHDEGSLSIFVTDITGAPARIPDGVFLTITLTAKALFGDAPINSALTFSTTTPTSLGSAQGVSLPVSTVDGVVQIQPSATTWRLYLPAVMKK